MRASSVAQPDDERRPIGRCGRSPVSRTLADYPALVRQLHPAERALVEPASIPHRSGRRLLWKCPGGSDHEWEQRVSSRTLGAGCPFCAGVRVSSTNCLATRFPAFAAQWHPTRNGSLTPRDVVAGARKRVFWACRRGEDHQWQADVCKRTLDGRGCPFCAGHQVSTTNRLSARFPEIAAEWHPTRNGKLRPMDVVIGSTGRAFWKCAGAGHVWVATVHDRTACGNGCPRCSERYRRGHG